MQLSDYKSGIWSQQYQYRSFLPSQINHPWGWTDPEINTLLSEANRRLGELNGLSLIIPDLDRFITMHVAKEAQKSSLIEGTETDMEEALIEDSEQIAPERRDDWLEVRNYISAMNQSFAALAEIPLSNRLLCDAHRTLMQGARGEKKTPGDFRHSQNWIGGATPADAVFVPPHHEELPSLLTDLEAFWHNENIHVPQLIRIAISHYQFETIHPFQDGNGRIGRLLITLYLVNKDLLRHPCLYLSAHLEKHRTDYYDALMRVRTSHDLNHWIRFFLVAVIETAKSSTLTLQKLFELHTRTQAQLATFGQTAGNARLLMELFNNATFISSQTVQKHLNVSQATADRLLSNLQSEGILSILKDSPRNRLFYFREQLDLFTL